MASVHQNLALAAGLLSSAGCSAKLNASASGGASSGQQIEVDATISAESAVDPGDGHVRLQVRIEKRGDELVQEGGEINFAYDDAALEGEPTFATLQAYADLLARYPQVKVRIEGHTDSRGSDTRNRELSERRANAVRDWLVAHGVASDRLEATGLGEDRPKVPEPPECRNQKATAAPKWCESGVWAANRRSEFHIVEGADTLPAGDLTHAAPAKPPTRERKGATEQVHGSDLSGGYVYLSPGLLTIPIATTDSANPRAVSYRWGAGVGYLWRRDEIAAGLGLGISHVPINLAPNSPRCEALGCITASDLTLNAELRFGGGSSGLIGYALVAPALALGISRTTEDGYITPGFSIDVGVGLWGWVWRGLFLGGEALVTPSLYTDQVGAFHWGEKSGAIGLRFLVGWHFGWNRRNKGRSPN